MTEYEKLDDFPLTPITTTPSSANKTGGWRTLRPIIDEKKCIKCYMCWKFCPDVAIDIVEGKPVINYDYCKGCGICAHECPVNCIEMEKEAI